VFLLLRAAGCFGEAARNQRNEKTRIALLYERNFSYEGRFFVWKIFLAQTFEVALQAYGKIPLFLVFASPFECLRADCSTGFGKALEEVSSASLLHAFVIFFYPALFFNVLYPTFLLQSRNVAYKRDFSFVADTALDIIYALVSFVFLALGVRSQPMIIPHDPIEYMSNMFPMLHAHFVLNTLERAAEEAHNLHEVGVSNGDADVEAEGTELAVGVEKSATNKVDTSDVADDAPATSKLFSALIGDGDVLAQRLYAALSVACVAAWSCAYCAPQINVQYLGVLAFVLISLALPLGARRAGCPSFSVWKPVCFFSVCYAAFYFSRASIVFTSFTLVAHGALVLFASPEYSKEDAPLSLTHAATAAETGQLPRWAAALYFVITAGFMVAATAAYVLESDVFSTCQPCECDSEGVLHHCDVFAVAESLTMVEGLNVDAYVGTLDLEGKGITKIHPGSFEGLWSVETLLLATNEIDSLAPGTFKGMDSLRDINLDSNKISLVERHYFDDLATLKFVSIDENPLERIQSVGKFRYRYGGGQLHSFEVAGEIHHVLRIDGGRETCRNTDENSCPDGMDIWVPRTYAHAKAVVDLVGTGYTRLCGIFRPGARLCVGDCLTWNMRFDESTYPMNSDGMVQFAADMYAFPKPPNSYGWSYGGSIGEPFQSIAGDPWFLRNVSGYAANPLGEGAFNKPGCWLDAADWSDDEGFMLLTGHGCNDCFTRYLCSSNRGDYLVPPQPPLGCDENDVNCGSSGPDDEFKCAAGYYTFANCCDQDADCSCDGHGGDAYRHDWRTPKCPPEYYECDGCCDRDEDCGCNDDCVALGGSNTDCSLEYDGDFKPADWCPVGYTDCNNLDCCDWNADCYCDGAWRTGNKNEHCGPGPTAYDGSLPNFECSLRKDSVPSTAPTVTAAPSANEEVCFSAGESEYEGHSLFCLEVEGELHNILHIEDGAETCGFNDANSCPGGFDIWVPRSYEHARAVLSLRGYNGYDDDIFDEVGTYERRGYDKMLVGAYINSEGCGSCGGLPLNSDAMATYTYGVTWQSVAGDPWFIRSTTYQGRPNDWEIRGRWLRMVGWTEGEGFEFTSDHDCFTSYYCSTNVARAAAPSPRPTVSPAPTSTADDVCASGAGEFDYENRTLHCIEIYGEIHSILPVDSGRLTCRHTDENSCPAGFDIWIPRSISHAATVLSTIGSLRYASIAGIYREQDGCGSCDYAMNSDATSQLGDLGWQSVTGAPWFLRSSIYPESGSSGYMANCWVGLEGWADGEGFMFDAGGCHCSSTYLCSTNSALTADGSDTGGTGDLGGSQVGDHASCACATVASPSGDNGCNFGACRSMITAETTCVYDSSFCSITDTWLTAADVITEGIECTCEDILDYPSNIGTCSSSGVYSPMVLASDCSGGTAVCGADANGHYLRGDTAPGAAQFTACDLKCDHGKGHIMDVDNTGFQGCEFHQVDWVAMSQGNLPPWPASPGYFYPKRIKSLGDTVVVGGVFWSKCTVTAPCTDDFEMRGPFSRADPEGSEGTSVYGEIKSYEPVIWDDKHDVGLVKVDSTGTPTDIVSYVGHGKELFFGLATSSDQTRVAVSGQFFGNLTFGATALYTNSGNMGIHEQWQLEQWQLLYTNGNYFGMDGYLALLDANLEPIWAKAWPVTRLGSFVWGSAAYSVTFDAFNNVYGVGEQCDNNDYDYWCWGIVSQHAAADGALMIEKVFEDVKRFMRVSISTDGSGDIFVTGKMSTSTGTGSTGASCEAKSCALTMRLSGTDFSVLWARTIQYDRGILRRRRRLRLGHGLRLPHDRRRHVQPNGQADDRRRRGVRPVRPLRGDRRRNRRGRGLRRRRRRRLGLGLGLRLPHDRRRHVQPNGQADDRRRRGVRPVRPLRGDRRRHRRDRGILRRRRLGLGLGLRLQSQHVFSGHVQRRRLLGQCRSVLCMRSLNVPAAVRSIGVCHMRGWSLFGRR